jgi:hypothetical protein
MQNKPPIHAGHSKQTLPMYTGPGPMTGPNFNMNSNYKVRYPSDVGSTYDYDQDQSLNVSPIKISGMGAGSDFMNDSLFAKKRDNNFHNFSGKDKLLISSNENVVL